MPNETKEVDGPNRPFIDHLLEELVGSWDVTGKIAGQSIRHSCKVEWVLNHQFLTIHFKEVSPANSQNRNNHDAEHPPYEAMAFVGYDNMSDRYVVHWLDIFGGRFSETLGFGQKNAEDSIRFRFEYPGAPLHNTFTRNPSKGTWSVVIEQKDEAGKWTLFADEHLERVN